MESKWICTGSSTKQYGRKLGTKLYEFKQEVKILGLKGFSTVIDEINLMEYTLDQIEDYINPYGYTYQELKKTHDQEEVDWLIAECIFKSEI